MPNGAKAIKRALQGLWPIGLTGLCLALSFATCLHAQQETTVLVVPDANVGSAPTNTPPVWSPSGIVNVLRNSLNPLANQSLELQPGQPTVRQSPAQQEIIPLAKPDAAGTFHVEENQGLISLMVRDGSLRQVVALIAETQKLNLVFAAPAETPITASFERVPWQQVLDSLLSASGHTWTTNNNVITVTSIENADLLSPEASGRNVEVFELDFASAVDIDQTVKGLLSPSGKSWVMETSPEDNRRTREVVAVVDYPGNLQQIRGYICMSDQPPRQVLIEAHILQVDLSADCRNGVNFDALSSFSGNELDFRSVGFANPAASSAFFLEATGSTLDGLVELLQTTTDAKTLASPKILAVSGQKARIQVGEQLGFRVVTTTQTSTLEEVQFLDVGVVLTVTPRITRDGRVLMRIKPEVSTGQVSPETGLPSEETTEVETDILLNDGQGMVIGGLIQETDSNIQNKVPWLGDLPYVGILFQKRQLVKSRSEIIVTLIPRIQPYTPIIEERENFELTRTLEPLTTGPLDLNPRLYEARLPDTFRNPRRPLASLLWRLPPVENEVAFYSPNDETFLPSTRLTLPPDELPVLAPPAEQSH